MAESSSTGNSGSTGTTSTSTSTSNSGPAAPGSQTSSNGSFSTGKGNGGNNGGSNNGNGKSNGNFSGGLPGLGGQSWSSYTNSKGSETGAAHSSGVQGPGLANGNFGSKWGGGGQYGINPNSEGKHVLSPNAEGKYTLTLDGGDGKGNYSTNNSQYITVDEVYGKGNQSMVESQGDYEASSNEKSNVETSTFGKQDEISVTPLSVTEDKGLVNNDAIQSVEGLDFQQKDKANQEVMEAKKSRDDAEAEDNANGMRNQLKAVAEKDAEETETDAFQVGEETNSKEKAAFIEAEKAYKDIEVKVAEKEAELAKAEEEFNDLDNAWFEVHQPRLNAAKDALNDVIAAATRDNEENGRTDPTYDISYLAEVAANPEDYADAAKVAEQLNEVPGLQGNKYLSNIKQCVEDVARVSKDFYEVSQKHEEAQQRYNQLTYELADLMDSKEKAGAAYNKAKESYDSNFIAENPAEKNTFEEQDKAKLNELNQKEQELENAKNEEKDAIVAAEKAEAEAKEVDKAVEEALDLENRVKQVAEKLEKVNTDKKTPAADSLLGALRKFAEDGVNATHDIREQQEIKDEVISLSKALGTKDAAVLEATTLSDLLNGTVRPQLRDAQMRLTEAIADRIVVAKDNQQKAQEAAARARAHATEVTAKVQEVQATYDKAKQEYTTWKTEYWTNDAKAKEEAAAKAKAEEAPTAETPAYKGRIEAIRNEINNSKDLTDEQKSEVLSVVGSVESAADAMNEAANNLAKNPNDINAAQRYVEETARYNKALKDAKGNKTLKNTNFNETFTRAVAAANDFMVTREDGTQQSYAEFAAEMATKSPELAKGLYEAKAEQQEKAGHKVLAAINRAKSKMVMTWLGSKFTFADNQVRNQFNQMAKTDMRATYATYNNVLSDETGKYSEADKAEAFDAIQQANSLMVASAALQASTGFFSGIGDSMSDGVYGTTKTEGPDGLNAYQKALNTASNFAKIALGLGVTPGANEAYQNMYYMAGAKVNESGLFGRDFDGDGFTLCQEYGNNAAVGMIAGAGELATAVALMFNPATSKMGINLAIGAVQTFFDALYGVQKEVNKSIKYSSEILGYLKEAGSIAAETGNKEATSTMDNAIKQIEDFQLKSDEVGNLDNWLEGSGSNTADNGKFNQALSYDEWLKLIEADPVMQEYARSLNR